MRGLDHERASLLRELLYRGVAYRQICAEVGCTKATVSRYAAQLGLGKAKRKLDWLAIRQFYEAGHSRHETLRHFGIYVRAWQEAVRRGDIVSRDERWWVHSVNELMGAAQVQRTHLRKRLVREGILAFECSICQITDWRGQPLSLELDHINGNPRDYRVENLRLLCPNCHSQTETFSRRKSSVPVGVTAAPARTSQGTAEKEPSQQAPQQHGWG